MSRDTCLKEVPENIDFKLYYPKLMDTLKSFDEITNIPDFGSEKVDGKNFLFS